MASTTTTTTTSQSLSSPLKVVEHTKKWVKCSKTGSYLRISSRLKLGLVSGGNQTNLEFERLLPTEFGVVAGEASTTLPGLWCGCAKSRAARQNRRVRGAAGAGSRRFRAVRIRYAASRSNLSEIGGGGPKWRVLLDGPSLMPFRADGSVLHLPRLGEMRG